MIAMDQKSHLVCQDPWELKVLSVSLLFREENSIREIYVQVHLASERFCYLPLENYIHESVLQCI